MQNYYEVRCICGVEENKRFMKTIIQCNECKTWQHKDCLKTMIKMRNYLCPNCQIIKGGLFYNIIYTLLEPSLFIVENNRDNNAIFHFFPDINMYPKIKKIQNNSPEFIIIRCLKFDKSGFSFHWPKMSKIYLNDKLILDFTKKGQKKKDKMIVLVSKSDFENNEEKENFGNRNLIYDANIVIIDDYIFDKKQNRFEIDVNYSQNECIETTNFAISINYCEILVEPNEIIKKVPIYYDKETLRELLIKNVDENKNILSTKEKIKLLDLYTESEKIKLPARGINCCHLDVFDLKTFLLLNRKTNKYQCPYCKRYANNLYIDGILLNFINDKNNSDVNEILLDIEHNILSYLHQNNNELVNNEEEDMSKNKIYQKDNLNLNKKFVINFSQEGRNVENSSFFGKNEFIIISNLGQIFEIIRNDANNIKNQKKYPNICLVKNQGKNTNKKTGKINNNISKYSEPGGQNRIINYNNHRILKIYDLIGNNLNKINNEELFLPLSEDENKDENSDNENNTPFLQKTIIDSNLNNALHNKLFESNKTENATDNNNSINFFNK